MQYSELCKPLFTKRPQSLFISPIGDICDDHLPTFFLEHVRRVTEITPQHRYLLLTKNVKRLSQLPFSWPNNVWLGTTVESNKSVYRLKILQEIEHENKMLSCMPLLDEISADFHGIKWVVIGPQFPREKFESNRIKDATAKLIHTAHNAGAKVWMTHKMAGIRLKEFTLRDRIFGKEQCWEGLKGVPKKSLVDIYKNSKWKW
jgi:protein gp37